MSWIVSNLIVSSSAIRDSIIYQENDYIDLHLESNDYGLLLSLEKGISRMYKAGLISNIEFVLIQEISKGKSFSNLSTMFGLNHQTVKLMFEKISDRIAFILGDEFTDEGYLRYVCEKYNLSNEQLDQLKTYMSKGK